MKDGKVDDLKKEMSRNKDQARKQKLFLLFDCCIQGRYEGHNSNTAIKHIDDREKILQEEKVVW